MAALDREAAPGGSTPVNWTTSHSITNPPDPPFCGEGVNGRFVLSIVPGTRHQVFACFDVNSDSLVPPRPGTPGI